MKLDRMPSAAPLDRSLDWTSVRTLLAMPPLRRLNLRLDKMSSVMLVGRSLDWTSVRTPSAVLLLGIKELRVESCQDSAGCAP